MFSNFKTANTLFKTVWTTCYQGCTENASQHPIVGNITAPTTAVAFPYLIANIINVWSDEVGSELNAKAALEDVGHNADLYIAIQEDNMQN